MTTLEIFRPPTTSVAVIDIDTKTVYSERLMAEHVISCEFIYNSVIGLQIGDFITYNSDNYYINRLPAIVKNNDSSYLYTIQFESVLYDLGKKLFRSDDGLCDFSYNGSAADFIDSIVDSINEIYPDEWSAGTVDASDDITLQFVNESCRAALTRISDAFNMEFSLSGKVISLLNAAGSVTALKFQYGRDKGLYKLTRQQVNDQSIITKCWGYGSQRNIPDSYRSRAKRLVFETGDPAVRYLEKNTALYGTIEGQFTDDNIYPQRTGTLTDANIVFLNDKFYDKISSVTDSSIDFDLNDYLIEGQIATIVFKTGDLSGIECEIWKYDHATNKIYFNAYTDADGYEYPHYISDISKIEPKIGDTYTLINITMPDAYVTEAEQILQDATQAYIDENSVPMVVYTVDIDPKYASSIGLVLNVGDRVTIVDSALGVNTLIRVSAIEYPLVNPYQIKAVIADFVPYTLQERIIQSARTNRKETIFVDRRQAEQARRNTTRQKELRDLLFDTDMYFDNVNLKPLSIETAYLAVGTKSSDFWLSNVTIKANYEGDENALYVSAGSLVHLQIQIEGLGYVWVIGTPLDQAALTPASAYYLYARCSKTVLTGTWVLSTSQITVESEAGFYHFLVGMLFIVADGARDFDFTNGMTYINGNTITTGKVQSIDGNCFLDLTQGKFKVGNATSSLDWNDTTPNVLTLIGALVQSPAGTFPIILFCGVYDGGVTYSKGNQVTSGGSSWNYINATPGSGHTPAEDAYWTQAAIKGIPGDPGDPGANGSPGPGVVYRGDFSAATNYFNNSLRRDIVKYSGSYYLYKSADNSSGIWDAGNWDSFGASFSSVATELLLATYATIENLKVEKFEGIPDITEAVFKGSINIENNHIWEDSLEDEEFSWILINYKGYHGGFTRAGRTMIGDGMGHPIMVVDGFGVHVYGGLEITTTNDGFTLPRMTTTQRNALTPAVGMMIYNTTTNQFNAYAGAAWYVVNLV